MNAQHKQRLLGFVILISLAVIVLPVLLDGEGYRQRSDDIAIPPVPESPPWAEFAPETETSDEPTAVAPPRPQPDAVLPESEPPAEASAPLSLQQDPPVLDTEGVPVAWTLQLGSFRDHDNAEKLEAQLRQAGYQAYLRRKDELTQVFVGPDIQRGRMEALRQRLKADYSLEGLVLRFSPD